MSWKGPRCKRQKKYGGLRSRALSPAVVKSLVEGRAYFHPLTSTSLLVLRHLRSSPLGPTGFGRLHGTIVNSAGHQRAAQRSSCLGCASISSSHEQAAELDMGGEILRNGSPLAACCDDGSALRVSLSFYLPLP